MSAMTFSRRLASLVLGFSFVVGFVGCGGTKVEETTLPAQEAPEIQDANASMENFMKGGGESTPAAPAAPADATK